MFENRPKLSNFGDDRMIREKTMANNTITAPKGFLAAAMQCGIKKSGKSDLGLLVCPTGANSADTAVNGTQG